MGGKRPEKAKSVLGKTDFSSTFVLFCLAYKHFTETSLFLFLLANERWKKISAATVKFLPKNRIGELVVEEDGRREAYLASPAQELSFAAQRATLTAALRPF